jgi:hypothetical protein
MNGPNKPEFYITLGYKGFVVTNTLTYWEENEVLRILPLKSYQQQSNKQFTLKLVNGSNKLEHLPFESL